MTLLGSRALIPKSRVPELCFRHRRLCFTLTASPGNSGPVPATLERAHLILIIRYESVICLNFQEEISYVLRYQYQSHLIIKDPVLRLTYIIGMIRGQEVFTMR